jgi:hypothetical protein
MRILIRAIVIPDRRGEKIAKDPHSELEEG